MKYLIKLSMIIIFGLGLAYNANAQWASTSHTVTLEVVAWHTLQVSPANVALSLNTNTATGNTVTDNSTQLQWATNSATPAKITVRSGASGSFNLAVTAAAPAEIGKDPTNGNVGSATSSAITIPTTSTGIDVINGIQQAAASTQLTYTLTANEYDAPIASEAVTVTYEMTAN